MLQNYVRGTRWLSIRGAYWLIISAVVASSILVRHADPSLLARLRLLGFDVLQQSAPGSIATSPSVLVVDIDERSIDAEGKWPWSRIRLAELVDRLFAAGVKAVAFDMVFPEATEGPLDRIPTAVRSAMQFKPLIDELARAPSPDDALARAISGRPVVLGIIASSKASQKVPRPKASLAMIGERIPELVPAFPGASGNLEVLAKAATGIGALNWLPDHDQILRRIPTVVRIGDQVYPSLVVEALRVTQGATTIGIRSAGDGGFAGNIGITSLAVGNVILPTDRDGQLWLRFTRHDPRRMVSAVDVLNGQAGADRLRGRVAVIGTSAPGLLDLRATPLDPVIAGVEINAQALEQLLARRLLIRPDYAKGLEIVVTALSVLLLAHIVYASGAGTAAVVGFFAIVLFAAGSLWAFSNGLLVDASFPILASSAAYIFGTGFLHYEAESERNRSRDALERIAREMEAAAQIQRTFLPREMPGGPHRDKFEVSAVMKPAKSVGGDFYDCFLIDDTTLGFAVGDVSGKGVPAALFMSVSRTVLRTIAVEHGDPGEALSKVNAILSRDNSEGMFVTLAYAVLDLETGRLGFSSAGHDDALLIRNAGGAERLDFMGPAIGLFEQADYPTATYDLGPGDTLLLYTDGITEAFNIDGRVFSAERVTKSACKWARGGANALVDSMMDEVARFAEGTEQSDDITCVAMQYRG